MKTIIRLFLIFSVLVLIFSTMNLAPASAEKRTPFIKGADVSSLPAVEDHGGKFYDHGKEKDALVILRSKGVNYIRLRLWNNPVEASGYNDLKHTLLLAKRAKAHGFKVLLDFHYSDFWADPGKQNKPEEWKDLNQGELEQAVYTYTKNVMIAFEKAHITPDMVQIGNEIQSGILWPNGKTWGDGAGGFDGLSALLKSGIKGVKDCSPKGKKVKVMLHLADGGDNGMYRWFFDEITKRSVEFDIIGFSYYPIWHGTLEDLQKNMNDISVRYNKDVLVAETAYAHTLENGDDLSNIFEPGFEKIGGYPATVQGQAQFLNDLMDVIEKVPGHRGLGLFYWEPAWLPVEGAGWKQGEGNAWENQAMFDFQGNALPSLNVFKHRR
ncbi:glycoside hydrolase family 53 protein [Fictibacillus fluitans]|uniref:Arabinogalactan endo-beta-1,4-galactanase n=1 Tax=Fictibacillus fluitans TaxID=3058422 RepID=A0ABT8HTQ4_9BACL|nr:glycosyl hydrolase 53 family protein [Fictibacillus sp. NE201]MDN4524157.1 glycosyl hydrolase 53 family protein [Fictibacillus sp. NE201]